jgi:hypothetical protein
MKIGKYNFDSKEQVQAKIDTLNETANNHTFVHLGNIILEPEVLDEEGEVETEAVISDKWHVDVLWVGLETNLLGITQHPYGWRSASVSLSTEGSHGFAGVSYLENKI